MNTHPRSMLALMALVAAPFPAQAQPVTIDPPHAHVEAGLTRQFTAKATTPGPHVWVWTVEGHDLAINRQTGLFTAPDVDGKPLRLRVRVTNEARPGESGEAWVTVRPFIPGLSGYLGDTVLPGVLGADYLEPDVRLLAPPGTFPKPWVPSPAFLAVRSVEPGTLPARFPGAWVVATPNYLYSYSPGHRPTPIPLGGGSPATLAVPPAGAPGLETRRMVVAIQGNGSQKRNYEVLAMDAAGTFHSLAGSLTRDHAPVINGPGGEVGFGRITGLAMDPAGNVFVADSGNGLIRMIDPAGAVTTVAGDTRYHLDHGGWPGGSGNPKDTEGPAALATFGHIEALARDPGTGRLYLADGNAIRELTEAGGTWTLSTVLGSYHGSRFFPGVRVPAPGEPCLDNPRDLQARDGHLFIADTGHHALRRFNLRTRALETLAGEPLQHAFRSGPARLFNPDLPPAKAGAVGICFTLGLDAHGTLAFGEMYNLGCIELGAGAPAAFAGEPERKDPRPGPAAPPPGA